MRDVSLAKYAQYPILNVNEGPPIEGQGLEVYTGALGIYAVSAALKEGVRSTRM